MKIQELYERCKNMKVDCTIYTSDQRYGNDPVNAIFIEGELPEGIRTSYRGYVHPVSSRIGEQNVQWQVDYSLGFGTALPIGLQVTLMNPVNPEKLEEICRKTGVMLKRKKDAIYVKEKVLGFIKRNLLEFFVEECPIIGMKRQRVLVKNTHGAKILDEYLER